VTQVALTAFVAERAVALTESPAFIRCTPLACYMTSGGIECIKRLSCTAIVIRVHPPRPKPSAHGGRPRVKDRRCFEGILWILWTGCQWSALPRRYGSASTCWRRLKPWEETGVLLKLGRAFLAELHDREKLRGDECVADGSFLSAEKGGSRLARPSEAKVRSGWL
jgi:transposase